MKNRLFFFSFLLISTTIFAQKGKPITPFEQDSNSTATYKQGIDFYESLAKAYPQVVRFVEAGNTDIGLPLHTLIIAKNKAFSPESARKQGKCILLINNAIHPGEPEGVDASMILARKMCQSVLMGESILDHTVLVIIPFYNVDGANNRNATTRANQNGPTTYGFRGNAKNLDLNRDFIKCDTKNAQSFNKLFNKWQPDMLIDNHTSNGADYQYTMTLIATQNNKLSASLGKFQKETLLPDLNKRMKKQGWDMTPYVNFEETPDSGMSGFLDHPRYSTGYATLHHCIGFMPETHMLKPFPQRVKATQDFMLNVLSFLELNHTDLLKAKAAAITADKIKTDFPLQWKLDSTVVDTLVFKGFEAKYKPSEVSGLPRLWYDRTAPYTKKIAYLNTFKPSVVIRKPTAYLLPQAYSEIAERLIWNGVKLRTLSQDSLCEIEQYTIKDWKSSSYAYEGHHPNTNTTLIKNKVRKQYRKGDYYIPTNQDAIRYIIETLEPQATDSYFTWNFFDGILMQKEGFSDYVFEDVAAEILKNEPQLRQELETKKKNDPTFAKSAEQQLDWVYHHSKWYEPTHKVYPVGRIE
jgi:hypothetical protein